MQGLDSKDFLMQPQKRTWIDTDITVDHYNGLIPCDVDDGYALGVLFRSQEVDIVGLSSTLGNTDDIDVTTEIATQFTAKFGPTCLRVSKGRTVSYSESQAKDFPKTDNNPAQK